MVVHTNVTVNFNVNIDASGNIEVFGTPAPVYSNTIVPLHAKLPVNALYDASGIEGAGGLIEFWEPSNALGDIKVQLADSADLGVVGAYQTAAKTLVKGLQRILVDDFDCSDATPFSGYTSTQQYYTYSDFGRVALSAHAHDLFGHVAATAAITNDQAFMGAMLSVGASTTADGQTPQQRYATWSKSAMVDASDVQQWDASQSREDANLAVALAKAIVSKGLSGGVPTISSVNDISSSNFETDDTLANIVRQVIGQDASRAMGQDNNELAPDMHQFLRFYEGDKVVVSITLKEPALSMSAAGQRPLTDFANAGDDSRKFNIVITLGPKEGSAPAPSGSVIVTAFDANNHLTFTKSSSDVMTFKDGTGIAIYFSYEGPGTYTFESIQGVSFPHTRSTVVVEKFDGTQIATFTL